MATKIIDTATPFLNKIAKNNPRYMDRAIKSAGWWMRKKIKEGIRSGAPGGRPYKPYSEVTISRRLDAMRGRKGMRKRRLTADHKPLGRLYSAVRYKFYADSHRVLVGWISRSAERLGTIQEEGGKVRVTPKMRRFFLASGFIMNPNKKVIEIPARPTIEPEYRENRREIPRYIENKIWSYMERDS